jgi:hypothetical protein
MQPAMNSPHTVTLNQPWSPGTRTSGSKVTLPLPSYLGPGHAYTPCPHCGKIFLRNSLKPHVDAVHLKLRHFKCRFCEASFGQRGTRWNHERHVHKLKYSSPQWLELFRTSPSQWQKSRDPGMACLAHFNVFKMYCEKLKWKIRMNLYAKLQKFR